MQVQAGCGVNAKCRKKSNDGDVCGRSVDVRGPSLGKGRAPARESDDAVDEMSRTTMMMMMMISHARATEQHTLAERNFTRFFPGSVSPRSRFIVHHRKQEHPMTRHKRMKSS